eukprot:TRINITY_DN10479_c0_g1_i7.p1 TRINITY_DN10479_c0_g1~~TRINITY_DN10479_c0_g1_i7.p1  ORF type:complete len:913 (-),score=204.75 TRINITY_DN10479_c0_g1_i7:364-3102(-)
MLVDPHINEESQKGSDLSLDNPLSQNPESVWGRFFRNAELERTIENDISRLCAVFGSFFQSPICQAMLRRILLLWSLKHPAHGYQQGMHELLGPLIYVLHVDVLHLLHVKNLYEDLFDDRFEDLQLYGCSPSPRKRSCRQTNETISTGKQTKDKEDLGSSQSIPSAANKGDETTVERPKITCGFNDDVKSLVLASDAYGTEGELGALLSLRFMEHDAYCMFDSLLSGEGGAVAMANYFVNLPAATPRSGLPYVIEASNDIYHLLAVSDVSLYTYLAELGVEPQYFALRWLRMLFGREFSLEDLLHLWDAIFASPDDCLEPTVDHIFGNHMRHSPRSIFIVSIAVSMILHIRSALFASPTATSCLQKLLNFPQNADVHKLIEKASLLQELALDAKGFYPVHKEGSPGIESAISKKLSRRASTSPSRNNGHKATVVHRQCSGTCPSNKLQAPVPDSYWEQRWESSMLERENLQNLSYQGEESIGSKEVSNQYYTETNPSNLPVAQDSGDGNHSPPSPSLHMSGNRVSKLFQNTVKRKLLDEKPSHFGYGYENQEEIIEGTGSKQPHGDYSSETETERKTSVCVTKRNCNNEIPDHHSQTRKDGTYHTAVERSSSEEHFECKCSTSNNSEASSSPATESTTGMFGKASGKQMKDDATSEQNSEEAKKLKSPTAPFSWNFRWFWNFGRKNTNVSEKHSAKTSKTNQGNRVMDSSDTPDENETKAHEQNSKMVHSSRTDGDQASCASTSPKQEQAQEFPPTSPFLSGSTDIEGDEASCSSDTIRKGSDHTIVADSSSSLVNGRFEDQPSYVSDEISEENVVTDPFVESFSSSLLSNNREKGSLTNMQTLGQSMLKNIQVIESVFSQGHPAINNGEQPVTRTERSEQSSMNLLAEKGQAAALAALTELRKISNVLSQM